MGDSIGDSIVTPYITNLSGKDSNRCQMTRMFFRPVLGACWGTEEVGWNEGSRKKLRDVR